VAAGAEKRTSEAGVARPSSNGIWEEAKGRFSYFRKRPTALMAHDQAFATASDFLFVT
jgi:hypothetical protein